MKYLLDTCVVLWAGLAPDRLSPSASKALASAGTEIWVAAITAAEIACAEARGRITLDEHWKPWLRRAIALNGWQPLAASLKIIEEAYCLPEPFHQDPADRIIAASARTHGLQLIAGDRLLLDYPHVDTLW